MELNNVINYQGAWSIGYYLLPFGYLIVLDTFSHTITITMLHRLGKVDNHL